jgi:HK97 family phage major capsid protein
MATVIKTGLFFRDATFERSAINKEARTVDLSFSSEIPVERHFGLEILDHSPESMDLSRLRDGAPLLVNHAPSDYVGIVELAGISGRRGKATVRFGNSARANEVFQDVQDGILKNVSVGYNVNEMVREKDGAVPQYRVTKWTPMEVSLVTIPADNSVKVGRSVDGAQFETVILTQSMETKENNTPAQAPASATVSAPASLQMPDSMLKESIREFRAVAKAHGDTIPGLREVAIKAEIEDWSVSRFRDVAGKLVPKPVEPTQAKPLDISERDLKWYSLSRAVAALSNNQPVSGIEAELSQEITRRTGRSPGGFWVPPHALVGHRSVQTTTAAVGGLLIETDNLADQFIELLRNKAQVLRLGAKTLSLTEPVTIPRQSSAGSTNWVAETAATTPTTLGLQQITLSPKCVTGHFQYGKQLLITSNPSIDALVRDDLVLQLALAIDQVALHGGGSGEPSGIVATAGIGSVDTATNGVAAGTFGTTFYSAAISLETLVSVANADMGSLAYLARSAHRGAMKAAQRFSSTDSPVWTAGMYGPGQNPSNAANDGVLNGYRAAVSNQIKTNLTVGTATTIASCIFFGNWSELLIGTFNGGAVDLVVDPYTLAGNRIVRLIGSYWCDVGVRHAASFAILNGIL